CPDFSVGSRSQRVMQQSVFKITSGSIISNTSIRNKVSCVIGNFNDNSKHPVGVCGVRVIAVYGVESVRFGASLFEYFSFIVFPDDVEVDCEVLSNINVIETKKVVVLVHNVLVNGKSSRIRS